MQGLSIANAISMTVLGEGGSPFPPDPVPDYEFKYKLDDTDAITRVGGKSFWKGKAAGSNLTISSRFGSGVGYYNADIDSAKVVSAPAANFTIGAWVKYDDQGTNKRIVANGGASSGTGSFIFGTDTGGESRLRINGTNYASNSVVGDGTWHHVMFVKVGTDFLIYIDGALDRTVAIGVNGAEVMDSGTLTVGASSSGTNRLEGWIDDVRWYARDLSAAEVLSIYNYQDAFGPEDTTTDLWVQASDTNTLVDAGAGKLEQWSDKSGNGNDLIELVGAKQGTIVGDEIHFVNGEFFDTNTLTGMLDSSGQFTSVYVHEFIDATASTAGFPIVFDVQDNVGSSGLDRRRPGNFYSGTTGNIFIQASGVGDGSTIVTPGQMSIIGDTGDGSNLRLQVNGADTTTLPYTPKSTTDLLYFRLGDPSNQNQVMKIKEVIHIAGVFDQYIFDKLTGYLAWENFETTDISAGNPNLPVGHPFKNAPPRNS